ncbi:MAG: NAD(P)-dependent oxidoreductase [bacterium]|nr:NAD(P)-dependent oxidoreductase [bacterium]
MKKLKILITGASGFVGSSLAKALADHELYLLVHRKEFGLGENFLEHDLAEELDREKLPKSLDIIIHQAALVGRKQTNPAELLKINVEGTRKLLEYGKDVGLKKFAFASSVAVYGPKQDLAKESERLNPQNLYAESKVAAEELVSFYSNHFETLIFRYNDPYGAGMRHGLVFHLLNNMEPGRKVEFFNGGENPKANPIYIDDLVEATKKSLELGGSHTINLGGPETKTPKEIVESLVKITGKKPEFEYIEDKNKGNQIVDTALMEKLLIKPKIGIEEGLKRFVA